LIPRPNNHELLASGPQAGKWSAPQLPQVPEQYTVKSGDNLWVIARRFQLRSKEIAAWNHISVDELLQPDQVLNFRYALENKHKKPDWDQR